MHIHFWTSLLSDHGGSTDAIYGYGMVWQVV